MIPPDELVARALDCDPATLSQESGLARHPKWDSLGHLNVMMALESHYGVEINNETIARFERMTEIYRHFQALAAA